MSDDAVLTPTDLRLLDALERTRNVVRASRELGIGRDRAVYRLRRLARRLGPVVRAVRGGRSGGGTVLTGLGRRLLARARGARPGANRWTGVYRRGPPPGVEIAPGQRLEVTFRAPDDARVRVELDPEAFVVGSRRVRLSARNVLHVTIARLRPRSDGTVELVGRWAGRAVRVALTRRSVEQLRLAPGREVFLYAKAVAVRRVSPGPLRS